MFELFSLAIGFGAGLVVGWNLLPQPVWIKGLYDKWFGKTV